MKDEKDYTYRSIRDEREYGPYWYSGIWRILRPVMVALAVALAVAGICLTGWNWIYREYLGPVDSQDEQEVPFEIAGGQSLTRVANNLEAAGLIQSKTVFKYYCDFAGMGQKIQKGTYALKRSMTMTEIADQLTTGDGNPIVRNITLIPGQTIEEFAAGLKEKGVLEDTAVFLEKCRTGKDFSDYYYISDVLSGGTASRRKYVLEGYLAADTYEIYVTATEDDILRKLLSQTEAVFPAESQERAEAMGMTMDQIITLASMIEKEAKTGDFTKVSAVFHNRLKANMKLESDVTVHYVTGTKTIVMKDSELRTDSPYNTYLYAGLPVGPICSPSAAAIQAALYPDETFVAENYLFFCAKDPDSGELYFSRTLAEHEQALAIYSPLWTQYDEAHGKQ